MLAIATIASVVIPLLLQTTFEELTLLPRLVGPTQMAVSPANFPAPLRGGRFI